MHGVLATGFFSFFPVFIHLNSPDRRAVLSTHSLASFAVRLMRSAVMQFEKSTIDKSTWGDGPWQSEPDRKEWRDKETGLFCLARRNESLGNWCGYVAVPPGHPLHGKGYDDIEIDIHGGLTYASACSGEICHVPPPGESDDVWWFGFDCGHSRDMAPGMRALIRSIEKRDSSLPSCPYGYEAYRDLSYVEDQCRDLAKQLAVLS